jgi:hypothetical protein
VVKFLLSRLKSTDVGDGRGDVFFRRYDLLKTRWGSVYLHQFFRGDKERCLHDHPWSFVSIVLRVGYWEEMRPGPVWACNGDDCDLAPTVRHWRRPGSILRRPAETAHRIDVEPGTRPWSLVFAGQKFRPWGFWTVNGWRAWAKGQPNPICETETPHA